MKPQRILLPLDVEFAPQQALHAGMLSCMYEGGHLRNIMFGETELIQMLYSALRDHNWQTIPFTITDEKITVKDNGFFISYTALYQKDDISFKSEFEIEGNADNSIRFKMNGEALSTFMRNRIGLCVHHPINECAGKEVTIQHTNGNIETAVFPKLISPHQPFVDISTMQWGTSNGIQVTLSFVGDSFETEDQRNWTDSSYKTYGTPLSLPFPAAIKVGDKVIQEITLQVNNSVDVIADKKSITVQEERFPFPAIGYNHGNHFRVLTTEEISQLSKIPLHHLRIELEVDNPAWMDRLQIALTNVQALKTGLELVICFAEALTNTFVAELTARLLAVRHTISTTIILINKSKDGAVYKRYKPAYHALKNLLPDCLIGYATDEHFAALNRNRPGDDAFDFVSFNIHPQVHASDNKTIIENLRHQGDTILTAKHFTKGKPVHISPISLGNSYSDSQLQKVNIDPRQNTWFAAAWMLLSIQNLAEAASLTYFELLGDDSNLATQTQQGPVFQLLVWLKEFEPVFIIRREIGDNNYLMDGVLFENKLGAKMFFEVPV
ncbi:hypothetical protein BH11BAC3_BH11BAC3_45650 [soil metagenome]